MIILQKMSASTGANINIFKSLVECFNKLNVNIGSIKPTEKLSKYVTTVASNLLGAKGISRPCKKAVANQKLCRGICGRVDDVAEWDVGEDPPFADCGAMIMQTLFVAAP